MTPAENRPRAFAFFNTTQFLGALNDNILKLLIIYFLIGVRGPDQAGVITATVGGIFVLPFLLFSAPAGWLADRLRKSRIIVAVKAVEVGVTLLAVGAFALGWQAGLYVVIFLMAVHSAFFAPAKYGVIPELSSRERLSHANGLVESFTYLAIVFGTVLASVLTQASHERFALAALFCVLVSVIGFGASTAIGATPQVEVKRPVALLPTEILRTIASLRHDRHLMLALIGQAYFTFVGAFAQLNLIGYGIQEMGLTEYHSGYLFLAAALGIGLGSLLAAKLSGRNVEFGIVPIGAAGLTLAPVLLHAVPSTLAGCLAILVLFGISAGLFSLPLQTFIQFRTDPARRGEVLAAASFINWVAILVASGLTWVLSGPMALSAAQGFSIVGAITLVFSVASFAVLPDFLLRFAGLVAMRLVYRLRILGEENLPTEGPALLVPNHVTWVDALLLTATSQRRIRFVMKREIYNTPIARGLFRLMGVIPVSPEDSKKELLAFMRQAREALDAGYLVCIFAEGALTRNGMLAPFRGGFERIVKGTDYPIIPVYLGGAWGSVLSYAHGRLLSRLPALRSYTITVLFGTPMPAASTAMEVRQKVAELSCEYFQTLKPQRKSLEWSFIECARQSWRRKAMADSTGRTLTYGHALTGAVALGKVLEAHIGETPHVGLLLPPSTGGALTNLALMLRGRVPVNLNYTASEVALRSAIQQCGITTIVTSKAFLEKLPALSELEGLLLLEDLLPALGRKEKALAFLQARFLPSRLLCGRTDFSADSVATVIFSSGSTGAPKGVMLSHHNILSNIEAMRMVFRVSAHDNIASALPFFHSLGFTATLWFPLVSGLSAVYHPNPMDAATIARIVREHRSTLLLGTPTFLTTYLRKATREDFASLRLVITGAEKLKSRLADAFEERFGVRPLEGYGATELAPVIALSLPDVELDHVRQPGSKEGAVGHPIPGVAIQVVDPETHVELKPGQPGLLKVKGPNVMLGYLNNPAKTAEAVRDGWYVTGDIGIMDEDGFIHITDRLSRFSKIAGEMVPHGAVEDELHTRLGQAGVVAVTALPDEKKGEKLVVIYVKAATSAAALQQHLAESALPNLWKPGPESYLAVDALPLLGTGKMDLQGLKDLARNAFASASD